LDQGASTYRVAEALQESQEYWDRQVFQSYETYLHRAAEEAGFNGWSRNRSLVGDEQDLHTDFLGSDEYFLKAGAATEGYVQNLYHDILSRDPDPGGFTGWVQAMAGGESRRSIAGRILHSWEADYKLVTQFYATYLHRTPDEPGFWGWLGAVRLGMPIEVLRSNFVGSAEYFNRSGMQEPAPRDAVLQWNRVLLESVRLDASTPVLASRNM